MRNIEFVSYSGKYPNLCSGKVVLKIDGKEHGFYVRLLGDGNAYIDKDGIEQIVEGKWKTADFYDNKKEFSEYEISLITKLVNENVPHGCCGGCI